MVDLDGARDGIRKNAAIVAQVAQNFGLKVELGGGIRIYCPFEIYGSCVLSLSNDGAIKLHCCQILNILVARYASRGNDLTGKFLF